MRTKKKPREVRMLVSVPHCKGTGWALWTEAGREDYVSYLQSWGRMSEQDARTAVAKLTTGTSNG